MTVTQSAIQLTILGVAFIGLVGVYIADRISSRRFEAEMKRMEEQHALEKQQRLEEARESRRHILDAKHWGESVEVPEVAK